MSEQAETSIFSRRTAAIILAVGIMSFCAVVALTAWAPELANKDRAGAHPYSSSAIGYGGLVHLLEAAGRPVSVSQSARTISAAEPRLLVLTPGGALRGKVDDDIFISEPALFILPKWTGRTDLTRRNWQDDTSLKWSDGAALSIERFDDTASVRRINAPARLRTPYGTLRPVFEEKMQTVVGDQLDTIIAGPVGSLVAKVPGREIYVLADPDLANTFGLAEPSNARLMLSLLDDMRGDGDMPIIFDATLHGFERSTSPVRILLDIPFIGATLTALVGLALLGWAACVRFGAPLREEDVFALGKEALTDNTAGLFTMTRRETRMAPGYLALSRKAAARDLGLPKGLSEADIAALFDRMGPGSASGQTWSQMAIGLANPSSSRDDLLDKAQQIYRWRKEKS
ncbi:MAG: DUF4350 domain-containing protein [Pseudomonadota bacterium]